MAESWAAEESEGSLVMHRPAQGGGVQVEMRAVGSREERRVVEVSRDRLLWFCDNPKQTTKGRAPLSLSQHKSNGRLKLDIILNFTFHLHFSC